MKDLVIKILNFRPQDGDSTFLKNAGNDLPECLGRMSEDGDFPNH
jgi:hypothetical protein